MPRKITSLIADSMICSSANHSNCDDGALADAANTMVTAIIASSASATPARTHQRGRRMCSIPSVVSRATASNSWPTLESPESGKRSSIRVLSRAQVAMMALASSAR